MEPLRYTWLAEQLAVCRMPPTAAVPDWLPAESFTTVSRTADELSIVCSEAAVPAGVQVERGWRALRVLGPLPFDAVGVLNQITGPLASAGIPIIAIGTFDTDYVLVRSSDQIRADEALQAVGLVSLG